MNNNLKILRDKKSMTQAELAEKVNISVMTYFRYETGERIPNVYIGQQLAKVLKTTTEKLFPITDATDTGKSCN